MTLEDFLSEDVMLSMRYIRLNVENLQKDNAADVLKALERLDQQFRLKNRTTIETDSLYATGLLYRKGWTAACRLSEDVLATLHGKNAPEAAKSIADELRGNDIAAISYPLYANKAVQSFLRPLLPDTVRYHARTTDYRLTDPDLFEKLPKEPQLSSLSVEFPSRFDW